MIEDFEAYYEENSEQMEEIEDAVADGELATLKSFFAENPDLLAMPVSGETGNGTWLHLAAESGQQDVCEFFLQLGIDINAISENNGYATPLYEAVVASEQELVAWFMSQPNIQVDGDPRTVCTPLMSAAIDGNIELCEQLLEAGADVNRLHGLWQKTALDLAVDYGHSDVETLLRDHHGVSVERDTVDWDEITGGSIAAYVEQCVGPVLPVELKPIVANNPVSLRLATVKEKPDYRLLFTLGVFTSGIPCEFFVVLPVQWPVNKSALLTQRVWGFPMAFLLAIADATIAGTEFREGDIITTLNPEFSDLNWPEGCEALIAVDHDWEKSGLDPDEELADDEVRLLVWMPVATKTESHDLAKAKKLRKASWAKAALRLPS